MARFSKKYRHISNQHPRICITAKVREKLKCLNLEPKMPYLGIFGQEFQLNVVLFEISTLEFV